MKKETKKNIKFNEIDKKKIILSAMLIILLLGIIIFKQNSHDLKTRLNRAKIIMVNNFEYDSEKNDWKDEIKITDKKTLKKVKKIINKKTEMADDEIINYRVAPQYILTLTDKKNKNSVKINVYYFSEDLNWITIDNENKNYKVDVDSLLKEVID